jgi:hypothetical protein
VYLVNCNFVTIFSFFILMNINFIQILCILITVILIYLLVKFSRNEYFDDRFIFEEHKLEPIDYAELIGEKSDWKIYKIKSNIGTSGGTSSQIRYPVNFKTSDIKKAGFEHVSDDQGVNLPLLIPYMMDIMRKQSIEFTKIQETFGTIGERLYELEK